MKAVILAAGVASRLRPLTDNTPKCLLTVGDQTIIQRTINSLINNGVNDIIIVTGYLDNHIREYVNSTFPNVNIYYVHNEIYETTNNIYSLWLVKHFVLDYDMLLLDSDIVFDSRIVGLLLNSDHDNCLALRSDHQLSEEEIKILLQPDGSIEEISKEVSPAEAIGESIGIEKFSQKYLEKLFKILDKMIMKEKKVDIFYEAAFQESINDGAKIYPVDVGELKCMELDTVEDFDASAGIVDELQ